jgi:hypothetical protein
MSSLSLSINGILEVLPSFAKKEFFESIAAGVLEGGVNGVPTFELTAELLNIESVLEQDDGGSDWSGNGLLVPIGGLISALRFLALACLFVRGGRGPKLSPSLLESCLGDRGAGCMMIDSRGGGNLKLFDFVFHETINFSSKQ